MPSARRKKPAAKPAKSRSVVPIQSSIESIKGFPDKLIIFKVPASKFWWTRYHDGKPIKRSTGTENKAEAIRFAKKFYETVLVNNSLGHSNNSRASSFVLCADGLIKEDELRAKRDELSPSYVRNQKSLINKHIKAFFRKHEIGDIDYAALDEFKTSLYEKDLAVATIKMHFTLLSKIFNYAERNGIIKSSPAAPKIKTEDNPRGYFTTRDYHNLCIDPAETAQVRLLMRKPQQVFSSPSAWCGRRLNQSSNKMKIGASILLGDEDEEVEVHVEPDCGDIG